MNIQPTYSSLDYPGKMALVLFTPGCNLRCKYCHNPQLLKNQELTKWDIEEIEEEVENNMDFIDAIVLSGGEPLLHVDVIKNFIKQAKQNDLLVKLDTNGLHPEETKEILKDLDYVAMDIKAPLSKYYKIRGETKCLKKQNICRSLTRKQTLLPMCPTKSGNTQSCL